MFGLSSPVGIEDFILSVLALIVLVISIGCIYAFLHAIFLFIFSQGSEDKKKSARNSIRYMIIGLILTIALLTVFPLLFRQFKISGYEVYTARNIFERAGDILDGLLHLGKTTTTFPDYNPSSPSDYTL